MKKYDIGWGVISACNMGCEFCYSNKVRKEVDQDNLQLKDWIKFIDENSDYIESINYGTGENSLANDWFELVAYISHNYPSIKQAVTTNGTLYKRIQDSAHRRQIVEKCISEIDVSLDFCQKVKHDTFRGLTGAYDSVIALLQYSQIVGIESTIVFIGTNTVLEENNLSGLFEIAKQYNAKLRSNIFRPTNIKSEINRKFIATYENILNALRWINHSAEILYLGDPLFNAILTDNVPIKDPSGEKSVRILPNGSITPSTYLISSEFRNHFISEKNVLQKLNIKNMGIDNKIPQDCYNCPYIKRCQGGVLDRRYLWYGTFNEKDPYCPYREGNTLPDFKIQINPSNKTFSSVHKDYLPTLFFTNK